MRGGLDRRSRAGASDGESGASACGSRMSRTFNAPRDSLLQVMMLVLLFCLGASCDAPASYAQELNKQNLAAKPNTVSALTKKVLDAIRNKDTNLLSALVDPTGIYIGFDTDKINAARFRKSFFKKARRIVSFSTPLAEIQLAPSRIRHCELISF